MECPAQVSMGNIEDANRSRAAQVVELVIPWFAGRLYGVEPGVHQFPGGHSAPVYNLDAEDQVRASWHPDGWRIGGRVFVSPLRATIMGRRVACYKSASGEVQPSGESRPL